MGGACTHTHTHTNTHAHTQVYGACYFRCVQVAARIWLPNCSWMPPYFLLNWFQWHAAFCSYSKLQKSRAVSMSGNAVACMVSCIVGFMLLTQHMPLWTYWKCASPGLHYFSPVYQDPCKLRTYHQHVQVIGTVHLHMQSHTIRTCTKCMRNKQLRTCPCMCTNAPWTHTLNICTTHMCNRQGSQPTVGLLWRLATVYATSRH
jgi:hypothetical protein